MISLALFPALPFIRAFKRDGECAGSCYLFRYWQRKRESRSVKLLEILGLGNKTENKPSQLSGGQQQRVSIARALMNGGQIILADEPTGALDSKSGAEVMDILTELNKEGHTVILVTHDPRIAAHAHRVITIKDGAIESDTVNDNISDHQNKEDVSLAVHFQIKS